MSHLISVVFLATWHGAPAWAWEIFAALLILDFTLPRVQRVKANSVFEAFGNASAWAQSTLLGKFPPLALLLQLVALLRSPATVAGREQPSAPLIASAFLPLLALPALLASGCDWEADSAQSHAVSAAVLIAAGLVLSMLVRHVFRVTGARGAVALALLTVPAVLAGCASGTDGLRQSCANTDTLLSGGYRFLAPTMHSDLSALRAQLAAGVPGAAEKLAAHEAAYGRTLGVLDSATSSMDTVCASADAIDAGAKRDIPSLLDQLGVIAQKAAKALADLQAVL